MKTVGRYSTFMIDKKEIHKQLGFPDNRPKYLREMITFPKSCGRNSSFTDTWKEDFRTKVSRLVPRRRSSLFFVDTEKNSHSGFLLELWVVDPQAGHGFLTWLAFWESCRFLERPLFRWRLASCSAWPLSPINLCIIYCTLTLHSMIRFYSLSYPNTYFRIFHSFHL
jgi:hypothetical protein